MTGSASALNKELIKTKKTFADLLPEGELKDYMLNNLNLTCVSLLLCLLILNIILDKKVLDGAVDWVNKNIVKKNKDLRIEAAALPGKAAAVEKQKTFF